jgi:hypothetical protein
LLILIFVPAPALGRITVKAADAGLVRYVEEIYYANRARLQAITGQTLASFTVEVAADSVRMQQRLSQFHAPHWAGGLALPGAGLILLTPPRLLQGSQSFETLFLHELTHLYVAQALGGKDCPWWLQEGIAMLAAGENSLRHAAGMGQAVWQNKLYPWSAMSRRGFFPDSRNASLAYAQAYYMSAFLEEKKPGSLAAVIAGLSQGLDLNRALYQTLGLNLRQSEAAFEEAMKKRFSWLAVSIFSSLWVLVAVLAAVGLVLRRKSQLRRMRDMASRENLAYFSSSPVSSGRRRANPLAEAGLRPEKNHFPPGPDQRTQ